MTEEEKIQEQIDKLQAEIAIRERYPFHGEGSEVLNHISSALNTRDKEFIEILRKLQNDLER